MKIPFIDLNAQYNAYKNEIDNAINDVLQNASFIGGTELEEFESNLAQYVGIKHAIGCSSGTSALFLALMALGVGKDDEVIVPSFTFIATAEMVALIGAKPVFVDIDYKDYNLSLEEIQKAITPKTKALVAVSIFGLMPDMFALKELCKNHNIALIEDGAQSFGASQKDVKSCAIADISCTSFFPSKPLGAYGDGGAIFTQDDELAQRIKIYLNHGQVQRYKHKYIGINARLDTIQAAILNVKLKYLDEEIKKREAIAQIYDDNLKNCILPPRKDGFVNAWAQYSVRVSNREDWMQKLQDQGIPTAVHYPLGLHLQEAFEYLAYKKGDLPKTELLSNEILSLPMSAFLKEEHQARVIEAFQ
ncbi:aminotransferase, DegT/DnrJ/EryC1/StrS family [Campylobacter subantarcticus LMG 24374]|uniref:Aminotransferase, DegT/DnrJ/EryC1/StrS family n=1 Tax=Campylobacter subantarcticus LMG 24374 TaxID=1388751 RepID=A0A0A8HAT0_9BACT|nr:aminotransferase, DegT/DnrJ/EryC1/StrS family [Campylobacter subantarcticus LMG 24374]EAJ1260550.1 DegT/DnrJ/EryC1/StrS family aminotransferase [Campylobacter lari]